MVNHPNRKRTTREKKAGNFRPIIHAWKDKPPKGQLIEPYASLDQNYQFRIDPYWNGFLRDCLLTIRMATEHHSLALHHYDVHTLFRSATLGRQSVQTGHCGDPNFIHVIFLNAAGELTIKRSRLVGGDSIDEGTTVHLTIPRFDELCNQIRKQDWAFIEERHSDFVLEGSHLNY